MKKLFQYKTITPNSITIKPLLIAFPLAFLAACANNQENSDVYPTPITQTGPDLTDEISSTVIATTLPSAITNTPPSAITTTSPSDLTSTPPPLSDEINTTVQNEDTKPDNSIQGDTPMTVLVIENPEVLSKLALANLSPATPHLQSSTSESLRRPGKRVFHFGFNQTALSEEDIDLVEKHVSYLKANPELTITVHGHTDSQGNPNYNLTLSEQRAAIMLNQFKKRGISEKRIKTVGWGGGHPLVSSLNFAQNRRIEIEYSQVNYAANH